MTKPSASATSLTAYLEERRRLCRAATPGEWMWNSYSTVFGAPEGPDEDGEVAPSRVCDVQVAYGDTATLQGKRNALFIADARTTMPKLLEALGVASQALERVKAHTLDHMSLQCADEALADIERILEVKP